MFTTYALNTVPFNYAETITFYVIVSTKSLKAKRELAISLKAEQELSVSLEADIELETALKAKVGD